jgi:hypothetical protein
MRNDLHAAIPEIHATDLLDEMWILAPRKGKSWEEIQASAFTHD